MAKNKYYLIAFVFLAFFLLCQFTEIYGDSAWVKFFFLITSGAFFISALTTKKEASKN